MKQITSSHSFMVRVRHTCSNRIGFLSCWVYVSNTLLKYGSFWRLLYFIRPMNPLTKTPLFIWIQVYTHNSAQSAHHVSAINTVGEAIYSPSGSQINPGGALTSIVLVIIDCISLLWLLQLTIYRCAWSTLWKSKCLYAITVVENSYCVC